MAKINNILVPIPISEGGKIALQQAEYFHKAFDMNITVLHVIPEKSFIEKTFTPNKNSKISRTDAGKMLREFIADCYGGKIPSYVKPLVLKGELVDTIIKYSAKKDVDLIIIRKSQRKSSKLSLINQNDADKIIASSVCPVITIGKNWNDAGIKKIMLPIDIMQKADKKVNWAMYLAKQFKAHVHIVTAINVPIPKDQSVAFKKGNKIKKQFEDNNISCDLEIIETINKKPYTAVIETVDKVNPDIVIIMTRKEKFSFDKKIGTFATEIIHEAKRPIFSFIPEPDTIFNHLITIMSSDK
jgi:nucleotide-binding universal stress UspA family protein